MGWRLELVRDQEVSEAFNRIIEVFEKLRRLTDTAIMNVVLETRIRSLKETMTLYQKLKVAWLGSMSRMLGERLEGLWRDSEQRGGYIQSQVWFIGSHSTEATRRASKS
jgi:hypothetical protein